MTYSYADHESSDKSGQLEIYMQMGRIVMLVYGLLMLGGGIGGYVSKGSKPSLISGIISAILLFVGFQLASTQPKQGYTVGLAVAVILGIFFIYRITETGKIMPGAGLSALSFLTAGLLVYAMSQHRRAE